MGLFSQRNMNPIKIVRERKYRIIFSVWKIKSKKGGEKNEQKVCREN